MYKQYLQSFRRIVEERFFSNIRGDLLGGLTAAIVALPIALAFGVASGLGAAAGLYGAIACGIFAALFGGTPGQVSGPTGPMTVVAAGLVAAHAGRPDLLLAALILGGLMQVGLGLLKAGRLVRYIPYPVVSGFMSGIGIIIICLQLNPLFGKEATANVLEAVHSVPGLIAGANTAALALGLGTVALIYVLPRLLPRLPAALVALALTTVASIVLGLDVPRIGEIPGGIPLPHLPSVGFTDLRVILTTAVYLALLGSLDSLLTSVIIDRITGRRHNSDQELIGQGIGNAVSGLIGGLPGAGATMRSVVNIKAGGRAYLSGVVHGIILLAVLIGLGRFAAYIPLASLAGILISVGIGIIDYRGLKSVTAAPRSDALVLLVVLFLTIFADLIIAVGAGFILACVLFVRKLGESNPAEHGHLGDHKMFDELAGKVPEAVRRSVYIYSFQSPFFFGEVENFRDAMERLPDVQYVVLDLSGAAVVDQTGAYGLEEAVVALTRRGIAVFLVGLKPGARSTLERLGALGKIGAGRCLERLEPAMERIAALAAGSGSEPRR